MSPVAERSTSTSDIGAVDHGLVLQKPSTSQTDSALLIELKLLKEQSIDEVLAKPGKEISKPSAQQEIVVPGLFNKTTSNFQGKAAKASARH